MPCKQSDILAVYQTQFFAKLHKQKPSSLVSYTSKTDCILKYLLSIESKGSNCNDGSFQVCGATGNLSFATNEQSNE